MSLARKPRNPAVIPQGMLAPSGYAEDYLVDPVVQSTTRPAGSILVPSPGFDTIRRGKNRFQGKGPTGGFRQFEFAEDIGGSGAALAVEPGDTASIAATEWLEEGEDQVPEGSMIIADRNGDPHTVATTLHEGMHTIADMGDRSPGRPLSRFLHNPAGVLRQDYRENPIVTVLASAGVVALAYMLGNDLEREYRSRRGGSVASEAAAVPASGVAVSGDSTEEVTGKISDAGDKAVDAIADAAKDAVDAIRVAGEEAKDTASKAANVTE
jgi:hypothetical protein